jgi:hypothetical protein
MCKTHNIQSISLASNPLETGETLSTDYTFGSRSKLLKKGGKRKREVDFCDSVGARPPETELTVKT